MFYELEQQKKQRKQRKKNQILTLDFKIDKIAKRSRHIIINKKQNQKNKTKNGKIKKRKILTKFIAKQHYLSCAVSKIQVPKNKNRQPIFFFLHA